jgi:hypothetical protein
MSRPLPALCAIDVEHLIALVELLDRAIELQPGDPSQLLRLRDATADDLDGDEVEIGMRPLERGEHPLDGLVGFRAPSDWAGIGVIATGRAWHDDEPRRSPFPVRTVHLVSRSGAWVSSWTALGLGEQHRVGHRPAVRRPSR